MTKMNKGNKTIVVKKTKGLFDTYHVTIYLCDKRILESFPQSIFDWRYFIAERLYIRSCKAFTCSGDFNTCKSIVNGYINNI